MFAQHGSIQLFHLQASHSCVLFRWHSVSVRNDIHLPLCRPSFQSALLLKCRCVSASLNSFCRLDTSSLPPFLASNHTCSKAMTVFDRRKRRVTRSPLLSVTLRSSCTHRANCSTGCHFFPTAENTTMWRSYESIRIRFVNETNTNRRLSAPPAQPAER